MTIQQYFSGWVNKILSEADPSLEDSVTNNQLRLLGDFATLSLTLPLSELLAFTASFLKCLEQKTLTWDDWPQIQAWYERSLAALKTKMALGNCQPPSKKGKFELNNGANPPGKKTHIAGVEIDWMKSQNICIKFQLGACSETDSHKIQSNTTLLKHICAGCSKLNLPGDKSHPAKQCPNKEKFFQ